MTVVSEPHTALESIDDLQSLREGWETEAKAAQGRDGLGKLPESFWETYVAMANTRGGIILLGVREREDRSLEPLGIADPDRVVQDLWNTLDNREKVSANVLRRDDVRVAVVEGRTVVVVAVPRAPRTSRPVYLGTNPLTGTLVRSREGDRRASEMRVRRLLADADLDRPADSVVLEGFSVADIDVPTLDRFRQVLGSRRPDHPFLGEKDQELLRRVRAFARDRDRGVEGLTVAGLLMFGKDDAIRDQFPHFFIEFIRMPREPTDGARWDDRLIPDGTWNANLLQFFWKAYPKLTDGLEIPFALKQGVSRADSPVHAALREALVNCLVHASYGGPLSIRVERRVDGYTFCNPGTMLVPPDKAFAGGESQCRNPSIQNVFLLAGLGERAGSGLPTILSAWRGQHWRTPLIGEQLDPDETTLELPMLSLFPSTAIEDLSEAFPGFSTLDETSRLAVATAYVEGHVTNRRLQQLTDRHARDLTFALRGLVEGGYLDSHGDRSGTWYTVAPPPEFALRAASSDGGLPESSTSFEDSPQSGTQSSPQSFPQSDARPLLSPGAASATNTGAAAEMPTKTGTSYVERVASSKWAPRGEVELAVLEVCADGHVSLRDIARSLSRAQKTIQNNYVPRLLKDGQLMARHRDHPSHPLQAVDGHEILALRHSWWSPAVTTEVVDRRSGRGRRLRRVAVRPRGRGSFCGAARSLRGRTWCA